MGAVKGDTWSLSCGSYRKWFQIVLSGISSKDSEIWGLGCRCRGLVCRDWGFGAGLGFGEWGFRV